MWTHLELAGLGAILWPVGEQTSESVFRQLTCGFHKGNRSAALETYRGAMQSVQVLALCIQGYAFTQQLGGSSALWKGATLTFRDKTISLGPTQGWLTTADFC